MNKKKYFFIIAFFIVIGIILLFSLKKDEIVNNKKTIYYVTLKGKGFDINQTLSCFTYSNKCKVKLPLINRTNYELVGWSKNDLLNPEYLVNESIEIDNNIELYAITRKKLTLLAGEEEISCYIYNDESSCKVKLPYYDNVIGYSLNNNGNINYNKGSIIKLAEDITIYPVYENKVEHTITINGNGASVQSNKLTCKGDNCSVKLPIITRNGYEIIGYSLKATDKTSLYKSGQTINVNNNMILYAITKKEIVVNLESVGSKTCNIYNNQSICSVYIPNVEGINGWSIVKNSDYIFYYGGKSYGFSKKIDLYPVRLKKISANFIVNGNIYTTKACTLNNGGCYIEAPIINVKGTTIYEYSTSINGGTKCLAGDKCYIEKDTNFYVHKGSYYRELDVYDSITIGKTTIEVQKGCSYSNNIRDAREAYNYFPKLFTNVKITFLTNKDYVITSKYTDKKVVFKHKKLIEQEEEERKKIKEIRGY